LIEISELENLQTLSNLIELNLANNDISYIGDAFRHNADLFLLNLSGNPLSLQQIHHLRSMPSLKYLQVNDPNYRETAACQQMNHVTNIITHLTLLEKLDQLDISSELRQAIGRVNTKKTM
jgi:hypothetical protein